LMLGLDVNTTPLRAGPWLVREQWGNRCSCSLRAAWALTLKRAALASTRARRDRLNDAGNTSVGRASPLCLVSGWRIWVAYGRRLPLPGKVSQEKKNFRPEVFPAFSRCGACCSQRGGQLTTRQSRWLLLQPLSREPAVGRLQIQFHEAALRCRAKRRAGPHKQCFVVAAAGSAQLRRIGRGSVWSIHARQTRGRGRCARRATSAGSAGNWKSALARGSSRTKHAWRVGFS